MKICKKQKRGIDTKPEFKGALPDCMKRAGIKPQDRAAFTVRWYRGQMRAWAGWWRDSLSFAMYDRTREPETVKTALYFAEMYRDNARALAAKLKGGAL